MSTQPHDLNPYAVPMAIPSQPLPVPSDFSNAIYQGNGVLIVHKLAILPDRCVKTNQPTQERLKRSLYWHHPALYFLILFNLLIYAIVAMIVRKSAKYSIPLSAEYKSKRLRNMLIAWLTVIAGICCLILGIALADSYEPAALLIIFFPLLLLTGALIGIYGCRVVYAKKIDEHFVWMGGVCDEFRGQFPAWPYG